MSVSWEQQDLFVSSSGANRTPRNGRGLVEPGCPVRISRFAAVDGIRELLIRKGEDGKIGITVRHIEEGKILICAVLRRSPAYLAGLRYGDEVLSLEDEPLVGQTVDRVRELVRKNTRNSIKLRTKDKPGERYVTVVRDEEKGYGFRFVDGEITFVRSNTSAQRQGLERKLQIIEVNEEVVVGTKDEDIEAIICGSDGGTVTLCVVPVKVYRQLFSRISSITNDSLTLVEL
ncbi:syntenin-1 [Anopheles gambiae]|uniref:PDZ domain-containing protein n=1 Tax=Anopheles coluzzii TaxID=1518534 RepID=A0A6E8WCQ9_ANOCL|nr:syntenin-1-like [Anopheles coluzzii]XP_061512683.1 syntenin-1 [Anopheles gambiae]